MFIVVGITGYYLKDKLITKEEKEAVGGCKLNLDATSCEADCSPPKGPNLISYQCSWNYKEEKCHETGKKCGSGDEVEKKAK